MKRVILTMAVLLCVAVQAQDVDLEKLAGYVDLEKIEIPVDARSVTDVTLSPALLKLAGAFCSDEDEEITDFGISSVRIKAFDLYRADVGKVREAMESIAEKLKNEDWESLVTVTGEEEFVRIAVKFVEDKPVGLMILAFDEDEDAAFVNVAGDNIDFKHLAGMGMGMGGHWFRHLDDCW